MNKNQAIKKIKKIQNGSGLNTSKYPESCKGEIAKNYWHHGEFTLGIEYGYILALIDIFKLKAKDLNRS